MANSKIPNVDLTDTFNTSRVRFNNLLDSVGDVSTLTTAATDVTSAINEHDAELGTITSGAMGTTAGTVSGAIAELDDRLDSINNTQIQSAKLLMNDSSAVSAIKGDLDVHGDLYAGKILYTDQIKSATASEQVYINDTLELQANDINDVNNIHLRSALIHDGDTNTKLEFGTDTIDLETGGTARIAITNNDVTISENLTVQDSAYVTGNLAVGGNATIGGTLIVDGEVTFKAGANSNINFGDGDGDNVVFNADVNSSIIPNTDNTYDLGSSTKEWRHGYFDGTVNADALAADSATLGTVKVSDLTNNRVVISGTSGELEDDTNLTFDGTTFEVGTKFDVDVATGNTNIDGNLDVDGTTDLDTTNVDGDLDVSGSFTTITTDGLTEGNNLYYTTARADSDAKNAVSATDAGGDGSFGYDNSTGVFTYTGPSATEVRAHISATDAGGDGSFTYDSATGVFTYTGPSATEVRAHISAGEGIDIASGVISGENATTTNKGIASFSSSNFAVNSGVVTVKNNGIILGTETTGNYVATIAGTANEITVSGSGSETASVTVSLPDDVIIGNNLTVTNDFTVGGSFTVAGEQRIAAQYIFLQDGTTGTPILNSGITVDRGDEDSAVLQWNETSDYWEAGTKSSLNRLALQGDSATFSNLEISGTLQVDTITSQTGAEQVFINDTLELQANDINDVANIYLRNNLYHDGDPNTYLGFGADNIKLRTGGTDRVEITNTQFILSENLKVNDSAYVTGNLQVGGNTVLQGNLEVQGTTTTVNTETIELADNFILLNSNATGTPAAATDVGIEINRGSSTNATLAWDEGGDYWTVGEGNNNTKSRVVTTGFLNTTDAITYNSSTGQLGHADTSAVNGTLDENNSGQTFIQSASFSFDSYGHVTGASLTSGSATDTNTTYSTSIPSSTTKLRLTGSDASTDDIEFVGTGATTVTRTNASKFTISSTDTNTTYSAGNDLDLSGTTFNIESTLNHVNTITTAANTDLTLSTSGTGTIWLEPNADALANPDGDVIMRCKGDSNQQLTFNLDNNLQAIRAAQSLILKSDGSDIYMDPEGGDVFMRGQGDLNKQIKFTMDTTSQTILATDELVLSGGQDIYLMPFGDTVYMRGGGASGQELSFQLDTAEQTITASDTLNLVANGDITLGNGTHSITLNADSGSPGLGSIIKSGPNRDLEIQAGNMQYINYASAELGLRGHDVIARATKTITLAPGYQATLGEPDGNGYVEITAGLSFDGPPQIGGSGRGSISTGLGWGSLRFIPGDFTDQRVYMLADADLVIGHSPEYGDGTTHNTYHCGGNFYFRDDATTLAELGPTNRSEMHIQMSSTEYPPNSLAGGSVVQVGYSSDVLHKPDGNFVIEALATSTNTTMYTNPETTFSDRTTVLELMNDANSPVDNMIIGEMRFSAENTSSVIQAYSSIVARSVDISDGTEDGKLEFYNAKAGVTTLGMTLDQLGDLTVQGDVNSLSDVRTKENIETVENGLDLVSQLRGVRYNKIGEEPRKVGVIAQEVEEVLPEVVKTNDEGMKSVDYGKMVGVLIEAIKELKQEIEQLKAN